MTGAVKISWLRQRFVHGPTAKSASRDDQLPHLSCRKRRPVCEAHLRSRARLGMLLRKIQGTSTRHDLRSLGVRWHSAASPQANGSHYLSSSYTSGSSRPCHRAGCSAQLTTREGHLLQDYVVTDPKDTPLKCAVIPGGVPHGKVRRSLMPRSRGHQDLLAMNLDLSGEMREAIINTNSKQKIKDLPSGSRSRRACEQRQRPHWMIWT